MPATGCALWSSTAAATLAINPRATGDIGWQLSFAAVAGLLCVGDLLAGRAQLAEHVLECAREVRDLVVRLRLRQRDVRVARPRRLEITGDDRIWYVDYADGYLGRFDPATAAALGTISGKHGCAGTAIALVQTLAYESVHGGFDGAALRAIDSFARGRQPEARAPLLAEVPAR